MIRTFFPSTVREPAAAGLNMLDYNPAVWLDAQDAGSVILTDGKVSQWSDLSGNNNHATQSDALQRPLYGNNAVSNGLPSIEITSDGGVGFRLTNSIAIAEIIFVTAYKTGIETTFSDFSTLISTNETNNSVPRIISNGAGSTTLRAAGDSLTDKVFLNGSATSTNSPLPLPLTVCDFRFTQNTQSWGLLKMTAFSSRSFLGFTGEIAMFTNELAAADRTDIVNHLMTKWAIS